MEILNISEKKFNTLKPFELEKNIFNGEAKLFVYEEKNKWDKQQYILKKLYNDFGTVFSNKLYTVNELIDKKRFIDIDELVMPDRIVTIDSKVVGFIMPLIENINFKTMLDSIEFSNEQKIAYFKEIGEILEKMRKVREYTSVHEFYLNDIHENNFILNKETGKINAVDLDSCKIGHNLPFVSKYLSPFSPINEFSKYRKVTSGLSVGGCILPDQNTDIFCYVITILNYLVGRNINNFKMVEFFDYLTYLHTLGVSYELIDKFALIFSNKENENPYEYLDELVNVIGKSHYNVYKLTKKK